jgi:putative phosphoribosyl transferase
MTHSFPRDAGVCCLTLARITPRQGPLEHREGWMSQGFLSYSAAGIALGEALLPLVPERDTIVLALARRGVVTGREVARVLAAPLDVLVVRLVSVPAVPELIMGAVARGVRLPDQDVIRRAGVTPLQFEEAVATEADKGERLESQYRGGRPALELRDRTVVLVDDGIATGWTMRAALAAVRTRRPRRLIVAAPVAARPACNTLRAQVDHLVCLATPDPFYAIGNWYNEFPQVTDAEVQDLIEQAQTPAGAELAGAALATLEP